MVDLLAKKQDLPAPVYEWARRFTQKPCTSSPHAVLESYRNAFETSAAMIYRINTFTLVAEVYDPLLHTKGRGVDAWSVIKATYTYTTDELVHRCIAGCPDELAWSTCVHKLLLESDNTPELCELSRNGKKGPCDDFGRIYLPCYGSHRFRRRISLR